MVHQALSKQVFRHFWWTSFAQSKPALVRDSHFGVLYQVARISDVGKKGWNLSTVAIVGHPKAAG